VPSKSLIPVNDPSLLWINSGVATLKDFFTGAKTPPCNRITNSQKSIRTNDIFNVGYTSRHHTMFEMLGNFSIGDYFKLEAIEFGFELLTKVWNIPKEKLYITVYKDDTDTYNKWLSLGIDPKHLLKCDRDRNFWDVGQGPCGPCTEIHYDRGEKYDPHGIGERLFFEDIENDRYIEIWNIVFSQFNNDGNNNYTELARKNIDTGAGLERIACIFQDVPTNFDSDLFLPIIKKVEELSSGAKYDMNAYFTDSLEQKEINHSYRVIADHMRAVTFAVADGAIPSNTGRGSILRKLIRRSMVCAKKLGISKPDLLIYVSQAVMDNMKDYYSYLQDEKENVFKILDTEQKLFERTLEKGYKLLEKSLQDKSTISGKTIFELVDTYGIPFDIIKDIAQQKKIDLDEIGYNKEFEKHQEISRANLEIKGMAKQSEGLINYTDDSEFLYDKDSIQNAKVIGLFDTNFNRVKSIKGHCWIVTDKTVLYATSGGQIHDSGFIYLDNDRFNVEDVIKGTNGQHFALIDTDGILLKEGDLVNIEHDKKSRALVTKNHSAEHLLEKVLRENIDASIKQVGAFKAADRMTMDFQLTRKLSDEEIKLVETKVNELIKGDAPVETEHLSLEDIKTKKGIIGHFDEVYSKIKGKLRLVCMRGVVDEICAGTHVKRLGEIEKFMIVKLLSKGSGLWRLECITSQETIQKYLSTQIDLIQEEITNMKLKLANLKLDSTNFQKKYLSNLNFELNEDALRILKQEFALASKAFEEILVQKQKEDNEVEIANIKSLSRDISNNGDIEIIITNTNNWKNAVMAINELVNENNDKAFVAINTTDRIQYMVASYQKVDCGLLIKKINQVCNGQGGGNQKSAQGGCKEVSFLDEIIAVVKSHA